MILNFINEILYSIPTKKKILSKNIPLKHKLIYINYILFLVILTHLKCIIILNLIIKKNFFY